MKNNTDQLKDLYDKLGEIIKGQEGQKTVTAIAGKWYIATCHKTKGYLILLDDPDKLYAKLFYIHGEMYPGGRFHSLERLATPEEIKEALVKEAIKRGFKVGSIISWHGVIDGWDKSEVRELTSPKFDLYHNNNNLSLGNICVFTEGKWATIIPQQPDLYIGPHKVKFVGNHTEINDRKYDLSFWKACNEVNAGRGCVVIFGVTVAPETIEEVIRRMEG